MLTPLLLALTTYVNPIDVNYHVIRGDRYDRHVSPADPEVIRHDGHYWLFASKSDGYFKSDDLAHWTWIRTTDLPTDEWAPTVEEIGGRLHYTARGRTVHRALDLDAGKWETLPVKVDYSADSALFADDGCLYYYWGGDRTRAPLFACELDPLTFHEKARPVQTFEADKARYGWEVRGDDNDQVDGYTYTEGSHMFRRGNRYYFQCAVSGTQFASYCDVALVGSGPLGPFRRQRMNPFSHKSTGYIPSAGHGKTFEDRFGNVWHVATGLVEGFNRRLVMFPVFFDADGEMWCDTAFGDWPFAIPDRRVTSPEEIRTGWMELAEGKSVRATSELVGHPVSAAVDGRVSTFWSAKSGEANESLTVDFGRLATVNAVQVGFGGETEVRCYRIEARMADGAWRVLVDEQARRPYAEHPYYPLKEPIVADGLRIVNAEKLADGACFAVRGFRAFGSMAKLKPAEPQEFRVTRDAADRRHATLAWTPAADATGYLVRFGVSLEKMHLSRVTRACRLEIRSLDTEEDYVWSVTAYNEAGFGATASVR